MRIIFGKELYEKTKNPLERLNEWYKRLDYFWGDAGIKDKDFSAFSEKYSTCPICNRKIERSVSARYGIPSVEIARVILRGVWLKEVLLNGQQHAEVTSELRTIDLLRICQESVDTSNILHFFHAYCPVLTKKLA